MLQAHQIAQLHDQATVRWHEDPMPASPAPDDFTSLLLSQHRANFDLWHEEDKAREPDASDARIAAVKHAIDALNQSRNDLMEAVDHALLEVAGAQNNAAPLHSESPGLILDRLSILALKIFHTAEEAHRVSASDAHRSRNLTRLGVLSEQRSDLARCLDQLWSDVLAGRRRFKLYRQMKMYNDPELNPLVYTHHPQPQPS
jgi:hypothetical protein